MVVSVGINGFGRIGRIIFRTISETNNLEVSMINDPAIDINYICYLIKFDSTHGRFNKNIKFESNEISIDGTKIKVFHEKLPTTIPWESANVQYVVEASGMFTNLEKASGHLVSKSVKRVILTAPSVDIPMMILGVNEDKISTEQKVISCASSTLYCLAPLIKVLEDNYGVTEGFITSIHAMTPSLKPLDGLCLRGKHWRDHRSIHQNIIPAATGACKALGKIIPQVKDKMTGLAFRVPIVNVSVLDVTVRLSRNTTLEDIIKHVERASETNMKNIIKTSNEEAVSSDFMGDENSCILDTNTSLQLTPNFLKLICWYENEYSYACRVVDTIMHSEKCLKLDLFFKLHNAYLKFKRPILYTEMLGKSCCNAQNKTKKILKMSQDVLDVKLSKQENTKRNLILDVDNTIFDKKDSTKVLDEETRLRKQNAKDNEISFFPSYLACGIPDKFNCINNKDIKNDKHKLEKVITANQHQSTNQNDPNVTVKEGAKVTQNITKHKSFCRPMSGDHFHRHNNKNKYKNIFESKSMIMEDRQSIVTFDIYEINENHLKTNQNDEDSNYSENTKKLIIIKDNTEAKDVSLSSNKMLQKSTFNYTNDDIEKENINLANTNFTINYVQTEYLSNLNNKNYETVNHMDNKTDIEISEINVSKIEFVAHNVEPNQINIDETYEHTAFIGFKNEIDNYEGELENNIQDLTNISSNYVLNHGLSTSPVDTDIISNIDRENQDIYDKLDSASATDSNNSFEINERKSQVINIRDLTASIEDIGRLEKICKIIEISDDLSDKLFSVLNNDDPEFKVKNWSFKDLCERLKLDDFYNKTFEHINIKD